MHLAVLLVLLTLTAPPTRAHVLDRVVVVVGSQVVLESEVRFEAELARRDADALPWWHADHGTPEQRLVDAAVIRSSAGDLALYEPHPEAIRERLQRLRMQFRDGEAWEAWLNTWGLDEPAMLALLRRRMVVERFLARNLSVGPEDREAWLAAAHQLVAQLRPRYRIRVVPERSNP